MSNVLHTMAEGAHNEEEEMPEQDIFYVAEAELASIKAKLKDSKEITKDDVDKLTFPENLADDAVMVPVDMRHVEEEFADAKEMVEKLGAKGAAEAFVKARDFFEANKGDGDCAQPMTASEWSKVLEEDAKEDMEEEPMLEGEEEALLEESEEEEGEVDEEEEGEVDEEDGGEPDAKRAKTD